MGKSLEVKLNYAAVGALLKGAEVQRCLAEQAQRIAGGGYVKKYMLDTRAAVKAESKDKNNDMLKRLK